MPNTLFDLPDFSHRYEVYNKPAHRHSTVPPLTTAEPKKNNPPRILHRSFTAIIQYTVRTSCVRLDDDELSTSAAH